ncbi:MAG: hypothetical protein KAW45_08730, partial [Thermoplasmatales archaeon]|nr:hypothetical protein [Thermoplasmatales archaeon]
VPARILHAFIPFYGYLPIPADLYYSCLDGPYNYNGDELWGDCNDGENGGDVDLLADVYIGRACVDNTQDVSNFVSKTIAYINSEGDPYLKKALQVGELLWDGPEGKTWGADYMDELIDGCFNHGYSTTGIPSSEYTISKLYDKTWSGNDWPRSAIINRINNNYHFINHVGHSTVDKIMKMNPDDVLALSNLKFNFIYSQGCFAGSFVNADCMAEYFTVKTDNGAVAAIMNAHLGIGQYLGTDGPSQRYHREFWDAVFGDMTNTFGKAIQGCREDNLYRINENFMRFCFYEINLFGDPAAELIHGPHPQLACYPKSYTTKYNRSDPVSFSFEIWNAGEETLYYSLFVDCGDDNDDCKWVTINPTQGGSTGEHDTIQVDIDTSGIVNIHETYIIWIYSNGGKEAFTINLDRKSRSLNRNIWGNEFPLLDLLNNFLNRMPSLQYLLQRLIE